MKWINPSSSHQRSSLFIMDDLLSSCSVIFASEATGKEKYRLCLRSTYSAPLQNYSLIFFVRPRNRSPFFPLWICFKVMLNPEEKSMFTWYAQVAVCQLNLSTCSLCVPLPCCMQSPLPLCAVSIQGSWSLSQTPGRLTAGTRCSTTCQDCVHAEHGDLDPYGAVILTSEPKPL